MKKKLVLVAWIFGAMVVTSAGCTANVEQFQCRRMTTNARGNMKMIFTWQEAYKQKHGAYASDLTTLQFKPHAFRKHGEHHDYALTDSADGYRAEARGKGAMAGDLWVVDQSGMLQNISSACPSGPRPTIPVMQVGKR